MQILLYEFITGGGLRSLGETPQQSPLLAEGQAMVAALAEDLVQSPQVSLVLLRDDRMPRFDLPRCRVVEVGSANTANAVLSRWAATVNATLLIAPESDGHLLECCRSVECAGGRLFSPDSAFVSLASDKLETNRWLREKRVPVPHARRIRPEAGFPQDFSYPAVLKPRDGAGSLGIRLIRGPSSPFPVGNGSWCLEAFCDGLDASVAVVCGPERTVVLPPCSQRLGPDKSFDYCGGSLPLAPALCERARRLARRAAEALPSTIGFIGFDLVLGPAEDGSQDVVIEVNPRMTTSYLGLRQLANTNLAAAILAVAQGEAYDLSFSNQQIEFGVE
jgi:predicted ATP-grasp superfamily ATP-dependent carboligase